MKKYKRGNAASSPPKRTIKAWAVIWKGKVCEEYGVKEGSILPIEPEPDLNGNRYKVKCSCHLKNWHFCDSLAIFEKRKEAIVWKENNDAWEVAPCIITIIRN